jgi:hypothetical protein
MQEEAAGQTALAELSPFEPQLLGQEAGLSLTAPMLALPAPQGLVHSEPQSLTAPMLALEPQLDGQTGASPTAPILALPAQQGLVQFGPHSFTAPMFALPAQQGLVQSAGQEAPLLQQAPSAPQHGLLQSAGQALIAPGLVAERVDWVPLQPARTMARHRAARVMIDLMGGFSFGCSVAQSGTCPASIRG